MTRKNRTPRKFSGHHHISSKLEPGFSFFCAFFFLVTFITSHNVVLTQAVGSAEQLGITWRRERGTDHSCNRDTNHYVDNSTNWLPYIVYNTLWRYFVGVIAVNGIPPGELA